MTATPAIANAQQILEGLKKTAEGAVLHGFIARGLRKFGDTQVEAAFLAFADRLLERYLANPEADPATRVRVRVIQQRLRPYIEELAAAPARASVDTSAPVAEPPAPTRAPATPADVLATEPAAARPAGNESLPELLARQMAEALTRSREYDDLLRTSLETIERSGATADVGAMKQMLRRGIEELIEERQTLEKNLASARRGLQTIVEDQRQLEQALDTARKHSLTDELTGLPNRTAFLRQLNAEIGRARRYGFSLALALIDVDDLKGVNARYGQAAGDAVLHTYAHEIMTQFRGYDLVARYGDDEFIVLLPNTQKDGAARAVEKVQKRASSTFIHFNGRNIPLPSFSSVLTLYAHGEPPAALLKRADEALSHAKQRGRAQAVVTLPAG